MTLRDLRRKKGISLRALAETTGLTRGYLSKIERSRRAPPVSTLQTLARALGVDMLDLIPGRVPVDGPATGSRHIEIVRARRTAPTLQGGTGDYGYQPLLTSYHNKYMCPVRMVVTKGETRTYSHDSEEFGYVLSGAVSLRYENRLFPLEPGDAFYFDSRIEHAFINRSDQNAVILAVNFNYRRF